MRVLFAAVLLALLGSAPSAVPASAETAGKSRETGGPLVGPEKVTAGKSAIVRIDRALAGDEYDWQVQPRGVNWISGENRQETFVILLDLDPGRYFISFSSFDKKSHATQVVEVDPSSPPDPAPVPPVPPGPAPLPDGKYRLAAQTLDWISTVPEAKRPLAKQLANSFRGIISAIAAGTITKPSDVLLQTRLSNNAALGEAADSWKPFGAKLQQALETLDQDGTLRTMEDYRTAWEEISIGLEAAATPTTR